MLGIARGALALLLEENVRRKFSGRMATLGVQTLYVSTRDISRQFERFSVVPTVPIEQSNPIDDKLLFKMMGFDALERLDYSDFEGADHVVDLNHDGLPQSLREIFDVVLDSGTLEHVFHVPNALKNIISLVKIGGRVVFLSPSSNHMDHGFYMFSPTFFVDYFLANKFEINTCYVVRYSSNYDELWDAYEYVYDTRRWWRDLGIGGLDDKPYAIFFVATRTADSTFGVTPQQNYYADSSDFYAGARLAAGSEGKAPRHVDTAWATRGAAPHALSSGRSTLRRAVGKVLRKVPFAYRWAKRAAFMIDIKRLNKKLVGRY